MPLIFSSIRVAPLSEKGQVFCPVYAPSYSYVAPAYYTPCSQAHGVSEDYRANSFNNNSSKQARNLVMVISLYRYVLSPTVASGIDAISQAPW